MNPINQEETPDYILDAPDKLFELMEELELKVRKMKSIKKNL
jgi:hypothetical protein